MTSEPSRWRITFAAHTAPYRRSIARQSEPDAPRARGSSSSIRPAMTSDMMVVMLGHPLADQTRTPGGRMRTTARAVPVPHPTARQLHLPLLLVLALVLWSVAPVALAEPSEEPAAVRGYQAVGPAVTGGASLAQAPLIAHRNHHPTFAQGETEDRDGTGTVRYYRIAVSG